MPPWDHIVSATQDLVFVRELSTFYSALIAGESPSLPALPLQYADYSGK